MRTCVPCRQLTCRPRPGGRPPGPTIGHDPATQPSVYRGRARGRAGHAPSAPACAGCAARLRITGRAVHNGSAQPVEERAQSIAAMRLRSPPEACRSSRAQVRLPHCAGTAAVARGNRLRTGARARRPGGRAAGRPVAVTGGGLPADQDAPPPPARLPHGRGHGRADHDPDHGLRVPIVTVVGGPWSVVRSGPAGFLKVSNIRSDLGV